MLQGRKEAVRAPGGPVHAAALRLGGGGRDRAHVVRREAPAKPRHQQVTGGEAGSRGPHHPVQGAFPEGHQPGGDRDRLRNTETIDTEGAGALRHDLSEEEAPQTLRRARYVKRPPGSMLA